MEIGPQFRGRYTWSLCYIELLLLLVRNAHEILSLCVEIDPQFRGTYTWTALLRI